MSENLASETSVDPRSKTHEDTLNNNAGAGGWLRGWQSAQVEHTNKRVPYQGPYYPIILSSSRAGILAEAGMSKQGDIHDTIQNWEFIPLALEPSS